MIEHRSVINCLEWMQRTYNLTHENTIVQKTSSSFDVSVWEFFWPSAGEKIGERARDHARFEGQIGENGQGKTGGARGRPNRRRRERI